VLKAMRGVVIEASCDLGGWREQGKVLPADSQG
jgi:hypothetical protein